MLHSVLLLPFRRLRRQPGYAAIHVMGLGVSMATCLLIGLFVRNELSYDHHHERGDRIVRVDQIVEGVRYDVAPNILAPKASREIPDVEAAVRFLDLGNVTSVVVQRDDRMHEESRFFFADSTVFDVFSLPMVSGDPATALARPLSVVLTDRAARRYFADEEPLGRKLSVFGNDFQVTGVLAQLPTTSHLDFDFLASFVTLRQEAAEEIWTNANYATYLLVREGASTDDVAARVERLVQRSMEVGELTFRPHFLLVPLRAIHLDVAGRRVYVHLFGAVAILILLIACVNYTTLATAQAAERAKEAGIRRVVGARRWDLVGQVFAESALIVALSLVLALVLTSALIPTLTDFTGHPAQVSLSDPLVWGALITIGAGVTLLAGTYPALLLSSFGTAHALKGSITSGPAATLLRRVLVTFQFAVSVFLLIGTAAVFSQLQYLQTTDLGFRGEQIVAIPTSGPTMQFVPALKRRLEQEPYVVSLASIDRLPGTRPGTWSLTAEGFEMPDGMDYYPMHGVPTEPGIVETLGLELISGTDLAGSAESQPVEGEFSYLINEATLRVMGWTAEEAIGRRFTVSVDRRWGRVHGVIRDYHFLPLREAVTPLALFAEPMQTNNLLVRLTPGDLSGALAGIEAVWSEVVTNRPFTYTFLDQAFAAHYETERQLSRLFGAFAILAVMIACLGLLGLSSHAAGRRRIEVSVRRVLGANVAQVVVLLSKESAILVAAGFLLAVPIAFVAIDHWLEGFAYHVEISPVLYVLAGAVTVIIALLTVSSQAVRAALTDPAIVLRAE